MFWEFSDVDQQICDFVESISISGEARKQISMTEDTKDAKNFYAAKKHEAEENIKWELSFVDSLFMMYRLRKKIMKAKAESAPTITSDCTHTISGILSFTKV